ncbi:MAG: hypothetical protein R3E76_04210 [Planctomycetota bacterium]
MSDWHSSEKYAFAPLTARRLRICLFGAAIAVLSLIATPERSCAQDSEAQSGSERALLVELPDTVMSAGIIYIVEDYGRKRVASQTFEMANASTLTFVAIPVESDDGLPFLEDMGDIPKLTAVDVSAVNELPEKRFITAVGLCKDLRRLELPKSQVLTDKAVMQIVDQSKLEYLGLSGYEGAGLLRAVGGSTLIGISLGRCTGLLADTELRADFVAKARWREVKLRVNTANAALACVETLKLLGEEAKLECDISAEWLSYFLENAMPSAAVGQLKCFARPPSSQSSVGEFWETTSEQYDRLKLSATVRDLSLEGFARLSSSTIRQLTAGKQLRSLSLWRCSFEQSNKGLAEAVKTLQHVSVIECENIDTKELESISRSDALRSIEMTLPTESSAQSQLFRALAENAKLEIVKLQGYLFVSDELLLLTRSKNIRSVVVIGKVLAAPDKQEAEREFLEDNKVFVYAQE